MSSVPVVSSVAGSAVGSGCVSWSVRGSERSVSGFVLVAGFSSVSLAGRFASRWASRLSGCGVSGCLVRVSGSRWVVSVPVQR